MVGRDARLAFAMMPCVLRYASIMRP